MLVARIRRIAWTLVSTAGTDSIVPILARAAVWQGPLPLARALARAISPIRACSVGAAVVRALQTAVLPSKKLVAVALANQ